MTTESKKTLQEICEKYKKTLSWRERFLDQYKNIDFWAIRGFLLEPDVMRAWWGEGKVDYGCGLTEKQYKKEIMELPKERRINVRKWATDGTQIAWQYHAEELVLLPTNDDILTYYRDHGLKGEV